VRPEIAELCDERVSIPQQGVVGSLNAAVSAGIVFYEVARQRFEAEAH
jgi:23S rRNA (guanosine2251-2'-O)-methyltransferase